MTHGFGINNCGDPWPLRTYIILAVFALAISALTACQTPEGRIITPFTWESMDELHAAGCPDNLNTCPAGRSIAFGGTGFSAGRDIQKAPGRIAPVTVTPHPSH